MSTSIKKNLVLVGATAVMAILASLALLPGKADAAAGTIFAGSTLTVGSITTALQEDCQFDDSLLPFVCAGFSDLNNGTNAQLLADLIFYVAGTSFALEWFILIEFQTTVGNCTVLVNPDTMVMTLSLAAGATYALTLSIYGYNLDGCGPLLTAAFNSSLLGPTAPLNPISMSFDIA